MSPKEFLKELSKERQEQEKQQEQEKENQRKFAEAQMRDFGEVLEDPPNLEQRLRLSARLRQRQLAERTLQPQVREILSSIQEHKVFFNPEPITDWTPLHRLTHLCDTFVFCGPLTQPAQVNQNTNLPGTEWKYLVDLDSATVRDLADPRLLPWEVPRGFLSDSPWGKYGQLVRKVGNISRELHFFYLGIEGVTAFFNLFSPSGAAPRIIWLCEFYGNWTNFYDWNKPLGQLVQRCRVPPEYLLTYNIPLSTWPHWRGWQTFTQWDFTTAAYVRNDHVNEPVQVRRLITPGHRIVRVRRGTLGPANAGDVDAVFTHDRVQPAWPLGMKVLMNADKVRPWGSNLVPQPILCDLRKLPMKVVLQKLTEVCRDNQINKLACIGFGYEDEGPELEVWRQEPGYPLEISIYCQNDGDVLSLGPYADAIE